MRGMRGKIAAALLGAALLLVGLELTLRAGGELFFALQAWRNQAALQQGGELVILCLGESTTAIGGRGELDIAYPPLLEGILNDRAGRERFTVINGGVPSIDSSYIIAHLEENLERYQPQVVVTMMGANDGVELAGLHRSDPTTEKTGFPYFFKTYRLIALLRDQLAATEEPRSDSRIPPPPPSGRHGDGSAPVPDPRLRMESEGPFFQAEEGPTDRIVVIVPGAEGPAVDEAPPSPMTMQAMRSGIAGRYAEAEATARRALRTDPTSVVDYVILAESLQAQAKTGPALAVFQHAIDQAPWAEEQELPELFRGLSGFYARHEPDAGLHRFLARALQRYPDSAFLAGWLARELERSGETDQARQRQRQAHELRGAEPGAQITRSNYRMLQSTLDDRGIILVAAQYPGRPLDQLRALIRKPETVWFVDNEASFEQALAEQPYETIFADHCYGDFGHATERGNEILASNIAAVIMKATSTELRD